MNGWKVSLCLFLLSLLVNEIHFPVACSWSYWVCIWWVDAKREIQKQLGGASFEYDQNSLSTRPRERRPGLLGNDQLYSLIILR